MQFDIRQLDTYRENNRLEAKKAAGGLPNSLWETYSSMANCYGGVIILGATENEERSLTATGVTDVEAMKRDLWNGINNPQKVSVNLLSDRDVEICELDGHTILVIHVPMAHREDRPVYINNNLFGGTYRRDGEGDYRCSRAEVKAMLRDQPEETTDMKIPLCFTIVATPILQRLKDCFFARMKHGIFSVHPRFPS